MSGISRGSALAIAAKFPWSVEHLTGPDSMVIGIK
jgi:hypothetical protein